MSLRAGIPTISFTAELADSPEHALAGVTELAARWSASAVLVEATIRAMPFTGNAWSIEATFKERTA